MKPLCDVTVFKGPSGVFSVSQDKSVWRVGKVLPSVELAYEDGESHHKTTHPRSNIDDKGRCGSFKSRVNATHAARKWADEALIPGAPKMPADPLPDRRGLVAHSRAKS